jgi:nitrite reductase (NADH) large subunit
VSLKRRLVIVGHGMAGAKLVEELDRHAPGRFRVTAIGDEPAYNRIMLSAVLAGDSTAEAIRLSHGKAEARIGDPVTAIDRDTRCLRLASGATVGYDTLVLATGSTPIMLPIPGKDLGGVVSFRAMGDVDAMLARAVPGGSAVVIGGGLLGLEAAEGLRRRGMSVTVVHLMPWLMERQLDAAAAGLLQRSLERRDIRFALSAETAAILGEDKVRGIRLKDGREIAADLLVMAVGIRPNAELARAAGLACGRGVKVDDRLQTSDPSIYAVGECVEHRGLSYGLVAPLYEQCAVLARVLGGDTQTAYAGSVTATSLKVTGIDIHSAGQLTSEAGAEEIVLDDPARGVYRKLVLRQGQVVGAVLVGDVADGPWYLDLMRSGRRIDPVRDELIFGRAFIGDWASSDVSPYDALEAVS